ELLGSLDADPEGSLNQATLVGEQRQLTYEIVRTWAYLMCRLRSGKLTMAELRRLTGILAEARKKREQEKQKSNAPESEAIGPTTSSSEGSDALDQSNRDNHGRRHLEAIGDHDKEY